VSTPPAPLNIGTLPVTNFMPPSGREFRFTNNTPVNLPAIGTSVTVVSFTVEQGYNGIINFFANEFIGGGFQDFAGAITWTLFTDFNVGVVAKGFANVTATYGNAANPAKLNGIRIKENQLVALVLNNISLVVAGQQLGGLLGGWYYPVSLEPPTFGF
jgi:hypothetical protein